MPPPQSFKVSDNASFRHTHKHHISYSWKMFPWVVSCTKGDEITHVDTYGSNIKWKLPLFALVHILLPPSKWKFIYPFTFSCCLLNIYEKVSPYHLVRYIVGGHMGIHHVQGYITIYSFISKLTFLHKKMLYFNFLIHPLHWTITQLILLNLRNYCDNNGDYIF